MYQTQNEVITLNTCIEYKTLKEQQPLSFVFAPSSFPTPLLSFTSHDSFCPLAIAASILPNSCNPVVLLKVRNILTIIIKYQPFHTVRNNFFKNNGVRTNRRSLVNRRQVQLVWRTKSNNVWRDAWEGNVLLFFYLKIYLGYSPRF